MKTISISSVSHALWCQRTHLLQYCDVYAFDLTGWMFYFFIQMSAYAAEIIFFQLPTVSEGLFINYLGALCHNTYTVNMYE